MQCCPLVSQLTSLQTPSKDQLTEWCTTISPESYQYLKQEAARQKLIIDPDEIAPKVDICTKLHILSKSITSPAELSSLVHDEQLPRTVLKNLATDFVMIDSKKPSEYYNWLELAQLTPFVHKFETSPEKETYGRDFNERYGLWYPVPRKDLSEAMEQVANEFRGEENMDLRRAALAFLAYIKALFDASNAVKILKEAYVPISPDASADERKAAQLEILLKLYDALFSKLSFSDFADLEKLAGMTSTYYTTYRSWKSELEEIQAKARQAKQVAFLKHFKAKQAGLLKEMQDVWKAKLAEAFNASTTQIGRCWLRYAIDNVNYANLVLSTISFDQSAGAFQKLKDELAKLEQLSVVELLDIAQKYGEASC